jgi:hypothetical protein
MLVNGKIAIAACGSALAVLSCPPLVAVACVSHPDRFSANSVLVGGKSRIWMVLFFPVSRDYVAAS